MLRLSAFTALVAHASGHGMVRTASSFVSSEERSAERTPPDATFISMTVPPRR